MKVKYIPSLTFLTNILGEFLILYYVKKSYWISVCSHNGVTENLPYCHKIFENGRKLNRIQKTIVFRHWKTVGNFDT